MGVPATLSSVPDVSPYIQYVATSGQTVYPYPFPITQDSDLVVVINGVTQSTDSTYTVSGVGNATGGNVTLNSGSTAGDIVTLYRDIPIERISQIAQNSGFSSTVFNNEFNNFYLIAQQLQATLALCLQVPNTNNPAPTTTLNATSYANKYLAFDSHGNPEPAALTSSGSLTRSTIGSLLYPQTAAETSASITPTNYYYPPGDIRRYGAACDGSTVDTTAITNALACNQEVWVTGTTVATGIVLSVDGQRLYGIGRGATIKTSTSSPSAPCVKVTGNRNIVQNLLFDGGSTTDDTNTNFVAVQVTGTRALIEGVATSGDWVYGIDFQSALYSTIRDCNIDGLRKRGVNFNSGGENILEDSMIFDSSLVAPTDALVYIANAPDTTVRRCYITRSGSSAGPAILATATPPPGGYSNQGLWIIDNDIDNGENWAVKITGWWNVHVRGNWMAWGQTTTNTGQLYLDNCKQFYIKENDINGSLLQGVGIYVTGSSYGIITENTVQYNYNNVQVDSSTDVLITDNISGQLTGLPTTGVATQNDYVESNCSSGCNVQWKNNQSISPQVADYSGITYSVVADAGYNNQGFNVQTGAYTLTIADRNGTVEMNASTAKALTVPASVFAAGDRVTVLSTQGGVANTIAAGSGLTLYWADGSTSSGTRTLTGVGYAVITFVSGTLAIVTGTGLS